MPDWPHNPTHRLDRAGAYIVTAATYCCNTGRATNS